MAEETPQRIHVDHDEKKYLIIVAEDEIRTTLSIQHDDGLALLRELTLYYGQPTTLRPAAPKARTGFWSRLFGGS